MRSLILSKPNDDDLISFCFRRRLNSGHESQGIKCHFITIRAINLNRHAVYVIQSADDLSLPW